MFTSFKRIIRFGWLDFRRQSTISLATVFILIMTIFLFASLFFLGRVSLFLLSVIQERVDVIVYFSPEVGEEEILNFKEEIKKIPDVKDVGYISKEEALEKFVSRHRDNPLLLESLEEIGTNPFFASLNISAFEMTQYASISDFLVSSSFKDTINKVDYSEKKSIIEKFSFFISNIKKAGLGLGLFLGLIAVLITVTQVKLAIHSSKEEIKVMKLVGASNWFIRGPFIVQGLIAGIIAAAISFLVFGAVVFFLSPRVEGFIPELNLLGQFFDNIRVLILIQFAAGIILGIFSSIIAIRKYLKT